MDQSGLVEWAKGEAHRLRNTGIGYRGELAAGAEFLRVHGGGHFADAANASVRVSPNHGRIELASALERWAAFVESGLAAALPFAAAARVEASTDLMEQADSLLSDPDIHLIAPIVLAGAALEEFLRSLIEANAVPFSKNPNINNYADELKRSSIISAQDMKDVTAWAGQRNDAAHGRVDDLSRDRARLMLDGVSLFMRQRTPSQT